MRSIAVIVANRNNGRFLEQCLNSVLGQSLKPEEIIVVDDASTDNSLDVLDPFVRDGAVTLVRTGSQQGVAAARILAIDRSRAPYITTLDSDDFYRSADKLAAESEALGTVGKGRIGFSDVMRVDENGRDVVLVSRHRKIREGDLSFRLRHLNGFIPRDYLVSREDYFSAGGYDPALRLYEDWDLKIRLSRQCSWHFSGVIGTAYRANPKGLSGAALPEHIRTMRTVFARHCPDRSPVPRMFSFARFFVYHSIYLKRPAV